MALVEGTVRYGINLTIAHGQMSGDDTCYLVTYTGSNEIGCVTIDNEGVAMQSTVAQIKDGTAAVCNSTSGDCTTY